MQNSNMIKENIAAILSGIKQAALRADRNWQDITLVAVTKTAGLEAVQEAIDAGIRHIAENRVQEAVKKFSLLCQHNPRLITHMIGHLQTNKVNDALKFCSLIQSVDSLRLAQVLDKEAAKLGKSAEVLIQFNAAGDKQKYGAALDDAFALVEGISVLFHVRIRGVMGMAPLTEDEGMIRKVFSDLRDIREGIKTRFLGHERVAMDILSMGMSQDYKIAIGEGSTMLRIGSAIFRGSS